MPSATAVLRSCEDCGAEFFSRRRPPSKPIARFCENCRHARPFLRPRASRPLAERFWEKAERGPCCWEWKAGKDEAGYGRFTVSRARSSVLAHRVAYELACGPIPEGIDVLHECDNPGCVCPTHLFLGTRAENVADMDQKGRANRRGQAKLTEEQVREIRARFAAGGITKQELASMYAVSWAAVYAVVKRINWAAVP